MHSKILRVAQGFHLPLKKEMCACILLKKHGRDRMVERQNGRESSSTCCFILCMPVTPGAGPDQTWELGFTSGLPGGRQGPQVLSYYSLLSPRKLE